MQKMMFLSEIEHEIERLDFQRDRIFKHTVSSKLGPNHDADFYMILLRRLYRRIEKVAKYDLNVKILKKRYSNLYKKIKIRDHFEHRDEFGNRKVKQYSQGIKVNCGIVINNTNSCIISGKSKWFLSIDHDKFKEILKKFVMLFPFAQDSKPKKLFLFSILNKLKLILKKLKGNIFL